tara:strand:- start:144 stop:917 length:774 start_codon:yes stop_codon:yes gene_type:complete
MKKIISIVIGIGLIAGPVVVATPASAANMTCVQLKDSKVKELSKKNKAKKKSCQQRANNPRSWKAPKGFKQPKGWAVFNGGATFKPCSTVKWHYDSEGSPENNSLLIQTIRESFDLISERTGLKFVEKKKKVKKSENRINLDWNWERKGNTSALASGGGYGYNSGDGEVTFNPINDNIFPQWNDGIAGFDAIRASDGTVVFIGNGWTVVHEVLHAMGFGHVDDPSSIMYPSTGAVEFSEGDIAGMNKMYLSHPCNIK